MSKKPFSSRLIPLGELVLVRKPQAAKNSVAVPRLAIVEKDAESGKLVTSEDGPTVRSKGVVVDVGRGAYENGVFVKVDERIQPGLTVLFPAEASFRFPDVPEMAEEGLWFVPASTILCILQPEGVTKRDTLSA